MDEGTVRPFLPASLRLVCPLGEIVSCWDDAVSSAKAVTGWKLIKIQVAVSRIL